MWVVRHAALLGAERTLTRRRISLKALNAAGALQKAASRRASSRDVPPAIKARMEPSAVLHHSLPKKDKQNVLKGAVLNEGFSGGDIDQVEHGVFFCHLLVGPSQTVKFVHGMHRSFSSSSAIG